MFHDTSDRNYNKLDPNIENDENMPANFQNETICGLKEDVIKVIKQSDDNSTNLSTLSYSSGEYEQDENDEHSPNHSSEFGDAECGEPTTSQRLTIDFTISNDDTEFNQKKCCDFWNFIYSMPHLKQLMVIPEPDEETEIELEEISEPSQSISDASHMSVPDAPAVDFFLGKSEGPVSTSFAAKQPPICRNKDYRTYCHGSCASLDKRLMEKFKIPKDPKLKRGKTLAPAIQVQPARENFLAGLCSQMETWDLQHPKCYDPPQKAPVLTPQSETVQYLSSSAMTPKELLCTSDMTCATCHHQQTVLGEKKDLVKKIE